MRTKTFRSCWEALHCSNLAPLDDPMKIVITYCTHLRLLHDITLAYIVRSLGTKIKQFKALPTVVINIT